MEQIYRNGDQSSLFTHEELGLKPTTIRHLVQTCPPRHIFPTEAELESHILQDPAAHELISRQVGIEITQVIRQVRTTRTLSQRMDLVASSSNPTDDSIVIELMLGSLNNDHVLRPISYAQVFNSRNLILVASDFPEHAMNLLSFMAPYLRRDRITVHLIKLETGILPDGTAVYSLIPVTPAKTPDRRQNFLEALIPVVASLGDDSLLNCSVTEGKKLESYIGLSNIASIRLYSGHGHARISIIVRDPAHRQQLRGTSLIERLETVLEPYRPIRTSSEQGAVLASYSFTADASTVVLAEKSLALIAEIYVSVRQELISAINSLQLPASDASPRVRFIRSNALSPGLSNTLNAVNRNTPPTAGTSLHD